MNPDVARDRIAEISNDGERKVAGLLHDMGLDFVCSDVELRDHPESIIGEVDLVFGSGDTMILVEVGTGKHKIGKKKIGSFSKWEDESNIEALKKICGLQYKKTVRAYFDLRPKPENPDRAEVENIAGPGSMNRICYQEDFDRFADGVERGDYTKDDFLAEFGLRGPAD